MQIMNILHVIALVILTILNLVCCGPSSEQSAASQNTTRSLTKEASESFSEKSISQPSTTEIVAAVKQLVFENSQNVRVASVKDIKIALDRNGQWWVSAVVVPDVSDNTDDAVIFMLKGGKNWKLIDLGTGVVPQKLHIPEEVRGNLHQ